MGNPVNKVKHLPCTCKECSSVVHFTVEKLQAQYTAMKQEDNMLRKQIVMAPCRVATVENKLKISPCFPWSTAGIKRSKLNKNFLAGYFGLWRRARKKGSEDTCNIRDLQSFHRPTFNSSLEKAEIKTKTNLLYLFTQQKRTNSMNFWTDRTKTGKILR